MKTDDELNRELEQMLGYDRPETREVDRMPSKFVWVILRARNSDQNAGYVAIQCIAGSDGRPKVLTDVERVGPFETLMAMREKLLADGVHDDDIFDNS